ncbi:Nickel transport system substrate-binding protein [Pseudomonas cichorii]|uniref:Nickel transport system substrate-binding protein n=1 Tax=Pseudomonas cichorii TaxID=36746 RepID=A0A3M4MAD3_PSECI|nr:Nickel transport system substrate-binding protein [Pseudomonas cichorii]
MYCKPSVLTLSLLGALFVGQASAHGLWTEQRRGNIEVVYGHGAEDNAFKAQKVSGAWAYDLAGRMVPVTVQRLDDHARLQPLKPVAIMSVALDNGMWTKSKDNKWINEGRTKVPGGTESIHTFKYSLAIYEEGARLPSLDKLKFVIVPQVDPLEVGPGKPLPVRVLVDGKPAAGIKLIGDYRSAPDTVSAETDAEGRATVLVRNEGLNVIAAEVTLPVKGDADIEARGLFTSLTFVGEAHHD